jgi:ferric-dicitrate binding protein FerR (iron transport regulator)
MLGRRMMNLSEHVDAAAGWLGGRLSIAPSTLKDVVDQLQRSMTSATSSTSQT